VVNRETEVNERIYARQVRVIDEQGEQKGVMFTRDALDYARSLDLDLVKIADARPHPVCKVVNAGKYFFEQQKAQKEASKKQRASTVLIKEVQLRATIDTNDLKTKARKAREFLAEGDKVKIVMRFRGRENTHRDVGRLIIVEFLNELGPHKVERPMTEAGNELSMMVTPIPQTNQTFAKVEKTMV
jgi:translation initiation factor IF-3